MSEKEKEKEFRFLIPVEKMPPGRGTRGLYDNILEEFIESGLRYAEVKEMGKSPGAVSYMLKKKLKERRIPNTNVRVRNKKVYLERLE